MIIPESRVGSQWREGRIILIVEYMEEIFEIFSSQKTNSQESRNLCDVKSHSSKVDSSLVKSWLGGGEGGGHKGGGIFTYLRYIA